MQEAISLQLKVNVLKPMCRLSSGDETIDFNDFDALDVVQGRVHGSGVFKFTECNNTKEIIIRFKQAGQNPAPDLINNYIPNNTGDLMARGIGVRLLDEANKIIDLNQPMKINFNSGMTSKDVMFNATVISVNQNDSGIHPGLLQTSIGMEISYN